MSRPTSFTRLIFAVLVLCAGLVHSHFGQPVNQTKNKTDQIARGEARINPSTLGMELSIPIGVLPGRTGNSLPVTLQYSSKVWGTYNPDTWETQLGTPITDLRPLFGEKSVRGWTTSLRAPYIEFSDDRYYDDGRLWGEEPSVTTYYVKRAKVFTSDGAAYDLRQDDSLYVFNTSFERLGTYLAVDGSKTRLEVSSSGAVFYQPDGNRILFDSSFVASALLDCNGNKTTYAPSTHQWTDTLGRNVTDPFWLSYQPTEGTQTYQFPGFNSQNQSVEFVWAKLSTQHSTLSYLTGRYCLSFQDKSLPSGATKLFTVNGVPTNACDPSTTPFDPILLTEVHVQNGGVYKLHYNLFGEIDKIEYPTGGYERFEYAIVTPVQSANDVGYDQFNRGIKKRWISADGTSGSEVLWQYDVTRVNQELPSDYYKIRTTAPDNTYVEQFLFDQDSDLQSPFGFGNIAIGHTYEENSYSSTGQLMSKKLTSYTRTGVLGTGYSGATRDLRIDKEISVAFEPGNTYALAAMTETVYDTSGNSDHAYFSSLNEKQQKTYGYVVVNASTASTASVSTAIGWFSAASPSVIKETDYLYDTNYKPRNIDSLATETRIKDAIGNIKAKTQIIYDESGYQQSSSGTMPTAASGSWTDPLTELGSTIGAKRGQTTTVKSYYDIANGYYIETHSFYDQFGNIVKLRDGLGNDTSTAYDDDYAFAFPTSVTMPVPDSSGTYGSSTAFTTTATFDYTSGLAVTNTDANGLKTEITYDTGTLRPSYTKFYSGSTQVGPTNETIYNDVSGGYWVKQKNQIDTSTYAESIVYFDGLGRAKRTQKVDPGGDVYSLTCYDTMGRVAKTSNPFRSYSTQTCSTTSGMEWTSNTFDTAGRLWKVTTPDSAYVETIYGVATSGSVLGTTVTVADQAGKLRRSVANALGQLARVDEPNSSNALGSVSSPNQDTSYAYDLLGNLTTVTQGSQTRTFTYDALSRLKSAANPESGTIAYTYDNNGNLTTKTDARSITTTYAYDNLNRVKTRTYSDSTPSASYYYDNLTNAKGKLRKVVNANSTTEYTSFDILERVTGHKQTINSTDYTTSYTYKLNGALYEETYPSGRMVKNSYADNGDLSQLETKPSGGSYANRASNFVYNAAGAVQSLQLGNSTYETTHFNSRLQPTQIGLGTSPTNTSLMQFDYSYGTTANNGNVVSQTITVPGVTYPFVQNYTYDSLNRLESATETYHTSTQTWKQEFSYDRYGNKNYVTGSGHTTTLGSCSAAQCNPSFNTSINRFASGQGYTYDSAGNITVDAEGRQFTYDAENKQTQAVLPTEKGGLTTLGQYYYDGDGKRVKKTTYISDNIIFVYDAAGKLIEERNASTGALQTSYVYAGGRLLSTETSSATTYMTADHLGSPRINTDASGNVVARHDYMPFGEEIFSWLTSQRTSGVGYITDPVRKQFTGKERDTESGLDYFEARYFSSSLGRFVNPDEFSGGPDELFDFADEAAENPTFYADLTEPQSLNKYQYCYNNPLNLIDPDGHKSKALDKREYVDPKEILEGFSGLWENLADRIDLDKYRLSQTRPPVRPPGRRGGRNGGRRDPYYRGRGATWQDGVGRVRPTPRPRSARDKLGLNPRWDVKTQLSSFSSFSSFKRAFGSAQSGNQWHHIVEQSQTQFSSYRINSPSNLVQIPTSIHRQVTGFYNSIRPFTGGATVRNWLRGQSFEQQHAFGISVLQQFGAIPCF